MLNSLSSLRSIARRVLRPMALLGTVVAVAGCAFAPGMYVGHSLEEASPEKSRPWWSSAVRTPASATPAATPGSAQGAAAAGAADTPPAGALIPITPDLVRKQRAGRATEIPADVRALFGTAKPYVIGAGDVLHINVWDHPELQIPAAGVTLGGVSSEQASMSGIGNGYNVSPDGLIQFPYAGVVKVAGLTEYEARDLITKRLSRFLKDPQLTVRILSYRSGRIYVDGEVRNPGLQALNDLPPTLPDVISRAGGFGPLADRSQIAITRNGKTTMVNLPQLIERGVDPSRILVAHGDLVRVIAREESKVFVLGEVSRPSTQTLRNGRLTLNEALGEAGGVNPGSADPRQIFVVRAANADKPEIFHLDGRSPVAFALAEGFDLQARDVVYVDPVPLVRWNRVISLILPSAQAVTSTRATVDAATGR